MVQTLAAFKALFSACLARRPKSFSFVGFIVEESNREFLDLCLEIPMRYEMR
jgi:hypothetical protein